MLLKDKLQGGVGEGSTFDLVVWAELQLINLDLYLLDHPHAHAGLLDVSCRLYAEFRHNVKQTYLFLHHIQKKLSYFLVFSIFLRKFVLVNHVRNLIG